MYPDIYRIIQPRVVRMCIMLDVPGNTSVHPNPSRQAIEQMTDRLYGDVCNELGYSDEESDDRSPVFFPGGGFVKRPRRHIRDITRILLIRELLRRRGR